MYSVVNYTTKSLSDAGCFTYKNDRSSLNMNADHAWVINKLRDLVTNDVNNNKYNGFTSILYGSNVTSDDNELYNNNCSVCLPLVQQISNAISIKFPQAQGRILVFDVTPKIIYDSFSNNNSLNNARQGTINTNTIGSRAYRMSAITCGSHNGHGIKHSNTSKNKTVYFAKNPATLFADTSKGVIVYAVSWGTGYVPEFLNN